MASDRASERRIPALDGVRGIAILLVLAFHFTVASALGVHPSHLDRGVIKITNAGWIGVDLFFVLSGFLITGILFDAKVGPRGEYFLNFYARRALRIWPVYFAFLLFLLIMLPAVFSNDRHAVASIRSEQIWLWTYLINWKFYLTPLFSQTPYIGHLWSLAIEEQFYLVWPAAVLLLGRKSLMGLASLAIVTAVALRILLYQRGDQPYVIYYITPARMDDLAIGALIALAFRSAPGREVLARVAWPAAVLGALAFVALFAQQRQFLPFDAWILLLGISFVGVMFGGFVSGVLLAPVDGRLHALLSNAGLRSAGKYSYAIYVVHWPVALLLAKHADISESIPRWSGSALPGMVVFIATALAITLAISIASWYLLEQPMLRLKRFFPRSEPSLASRRNVAPASSVAPATLVVENEGQS